VTTLARESRDVHIETPARAGYLVLARLALSAICRLTSLEHTEVADLKLAVTEAASGFLADGDTPSDSVIEFNFRLAEDRLELELRGTQGDAPAAERELSHAIVEATVDDFQLEPGRAVLVKRLAA
jgi:anti-sigma regulatory factor (Ser/Thr protein kinase)